MGAYQPWPRVGLLAESVWVREEEIAGWAAAAGGWEQGFQRREITAVAASSSQDAAKACSSAGSIVCRRRVAVQGRQVEVEMACALVLVWRQAKCCVGGKIGEARGGDGLVGFTAGGVPVVADRARRPINPSMACRVDDGDRASWSGAVLVVIISESGVAADSKTNGLLVGCGTNPYVSICFRPASHFSGTLSLLTTTRGLSVQGLLIRGDLSQLVVACPVSAPSTTGSHSSVSELVLRDEPDVSRPLSASARSVFIRSQRGDLPLALLFFPLLFYPCTAAGGWATEFLPPALYRSHGSRASAPRFAFAPLPL
ncbi:hypothetical protein RHS01_10253 [Rhizoctonia solani]|uniref:Uncharacterized protein n=1 Tax=Rhizoctonia solani TaxID=456999 RepID=A0A8H7I5V6_9AGAM|nr:hypothetical protein RHS01_10253 [Rhizoctonia solani]